MSNEGKQVARWTALVAGSAVVGAGIGLLFAPQTGMDFHGADTTPGS